MKPGYYEFHDEYQKLRGCKKYVCIYMCFTGDRNKSLGREEILIKDIKNQYKKYSDKNIVTSLKYFLKKGWIRTEERKLGIYYFANPEIVDHFLTPSPEEEAKMKEMEEYWEIQKREARKMKRKKII